MAKAGGTEPRRRNMTQVVKPKNGMEDFAALIESNGFYVDKTRFLPMVMTQTDNDIVLFTRPRRFGKTMIMTMFQEFLQLDYNDPGNTERQQRLFKGLDVLEDHEFCEEYMGKFPVLGISLKDAWGIDYADAVDSLAVTEASFASDFEFLLDSKKLNKIEKRNYEILCDHLALLRPRNRGLLKDCLTMLTSMLAKHFERQVVLLIDEYDVPLAKAQEGGYHDKMSKLYTQFLSIVKPRKASAPIRKIIMTGCLKVAKNGIFSGANNFTADTVVSMNSDFASLMGFTSEEAERYINAFGLSKYMDLVKANYDGYRFGKEEIFCPWDVALFTSDAQKSIKRNLKVEAGNYWVNSDSTGTKAIQSYVDYLRDTEPQKLQDLSDGKEIEIAVNDDMSYDCIKEHHADDFWSLLLHTGYLTAVEKLNDNNYRVRIPNLEIMNCFERSILASFNAAVASSGTGVRLAKALLHGDTEGSRKIIAQVLRTYVAPGRIDAARRNDQEGFYRGMLAGIFTDCNAISGLQTEKALGYGFADLIFKSPDGDVGVVAEFKVARGSRLKKSAALRAIRQIKDRNYAEEFMEDETMRRVLAIGISFFKRECHVEAEMLKGGKKPKAE